MQMLISGIADPPPPDPYALPISKYKETRMKSTKELLHQHKRALNKTPIEVSRVNHHESLYTTTTANNSPQKASP